MGRSRGAGVHGETVTAVHRGDALPHGLLGVVEVGLAAQEGASHGCRVQREPPQGRESIGAIRDDGGAEDAGVEDAMRLHRRPAGEDRRIPQRVDGEAPVEPHDLGGCFRERGTASRDSVEILD